MQLECGVVTRLPDDILRGIARRLERELARRRIERRALRIDGSDVGWIDSDRAQMLARFADVFAVHADRVELTDRRLSDDKDVLLDTRSRSVARCVRALAEEGALTQWRNEQYGVRERFADPPRLLLERAAARFFGVRTYAAHGNGVTGEPAAPSMWLARRSPHKAIDPGMLDNLVGGGIAWGSAPFDTLVKEAWEEAGITAPLARLAQRGGTIDMARDVPDGLQRETIYAYDLWLPHDFVPVNQDGEAVEHRCVDLPAVARLLANESGPDVVTVDATLVAVDFLLRHGAVEPDSAEYVRLSALLQSGRSARFDR
jgi:8-oxo-dGTP pyrophosphatase MutT (NUDIX family)